MTPKTFNAKAQSRKELFWKKMRSQGEIGLNKRILAEFCKKFLRLGGFALKVFWRFERYLSDRKASYAVLPFLY